jgi:predicted MFS family arabinose efflux permease
VTVPAEDLDRASGRTLVTLSCGGFASQASIRLCDPMLPQLAADLGGTLGQAAQTITAFAIGYGVFQLVHGPMGDRFGKLRVVSVASLAAAVASLACAFAGGLAQLVALRFFAGAACAALIPLSLAWIGDAVPYASRQRVLARFLTGSTIGIVFGQVGGGVLADTVGWRLSFVLPAAVLLAVAAALVPQAARAAAAAAGDGDRVPEAPTGGARVRESIARAPMRGLRAVAGQFGSVLSSRWARLIVAAVFVEGVLVFGAFAFVPSWLHLRFELPLWQSGLSAAGFGVGGLAYALASPWLIAKLGERGLMLAGAGVFAAGLLSLGNAWWPANAASCAAAGLGFFMLHNTLQTLATQMAPHARGTAIATFAACLFAGQSSGVALASSLVGSIGYETVFLGSALSLPALAGALALAVSRRRRPG